MQSWWLRRSILSIPERNGFVDRVLVFSNQLPRFFMGVGLTFRHLTVPQVWVPEDFTVRSPRWWRDKIGGTVAVCQTSQRRQAPWIQ